MQSDCACLKFFASRNSSRMKPTYGPAVSSQQLLRLQVAETPTRRRATPEACGALEVDAQSIATTDVRSEATTWIDSVIAGPSGETAGGPKGRMSRQQLDRLSEELKEQLDQ
ncbi:unnamed protein product, partial [Polarella glacialis]